jgi:hypothetical protein
MHQKNSEVKKFWLEICNLLVDLQDPNGEMKISFSPIKEWMMMSVFIQNGILILPNGEAKNAHSLSLLNESN